MPPWSSPQRPAREQLGQAQTDGEQQHNKTEADAEQMRQGRPKAVVDAGGQQHQVVGSRSDRGHQGKGEERGELVGGKVRNLSDAESRLGRWIFRPNGTEGFAKAEVTVGGISTANLSSQTMVAKTVPNLYAVGEAVDVTGWLGGYNFQWAWASGHAAGQVI